MNIDNTANKKKALFIIIVISIIAVIFVPVLYSGIYLSAFWDPYGNFNNVPVAFVNLDKPVEKNGKKYNIGEDIETNLRENTKIGWKFVDHDDAKNGLMNNNYYAMIIIPEDFSQKISNASEGNLIKPTITYEANKGKIFVFAQVSERAAESIKSEVASNIQKETTKALANSLYDIKTSLNDASKGTSELQDGIQKLYTGSNQLSSGLNAAANGSVLLKTGLEEAASGEAQLNVGIDSLLAGLNNFKTKASQSSDSLSTLVVGATSVSNGLSTIMQKDETKSSAGKLSNAANTIQEINAGLTSISEKLSTATDPKTINDVQNTLAKLTTKLKDTELETQLRDASTNSQTLLNKLGKLSEISKKVSDGTNQLASTLAITQNSTVSGINQLIDGTNKLKSGSDQILNGLNTAVTKTGDLSSGLQTLNNGASDLNTGLSKANEGTTKLNNGLITGYTTINDKLKFTVEDISSFITNPLTLSDESINAVTYYGEGLAPYFISLSLWLGAMLMNLILSLSRLSKLFQYKFIRKYTGTFLIGCSLVTLQSLLLSFVLVLLLKIHTTNLLMFFLWNIFVSVTFFSIMYGIAYAIGLLGTPVVFVLFILQLASSGGTFPIETAPHFYRSVSIIFPMTYTVETLRMIISGINSATLVKDSIILLSYILIFYVGGFLINRTFKGLRNLKAEAETEAEQPQ